MGLAELVIICAVLVAALIFFFMSNAARQSPKAKVERPTSIDWNALSDAELQSHLPHMKIHAIKRYRDLTGVGLKEAKDAVDYAVAHPDSIKKGKTGAIVDTDGAGVRDLIAEGRIDEAVDVYAAFMGVDEYTARDAIAQMQREDEAGIRLSDDSMGEIRDLLTRGNKIEAIKLYREVTNLGLKEAKDAVDRMERDEY